MVRWQRFGLGIVLLGAALAGTGYGESADRSALVPQALPANVLSRCGAPTGNAAYSINWLSSLPRGGVFLVRAAQCRYGQGGAWIVRVERGQSDAVLPIAGSFRLLASRSAYPVVESDQRLFPGVFERQRFVWRAGRYWLAARHRVFSVAGRVCGTRTQCEQSARAAFEDGRIAQALLIWRTVDHASWI